MKTPYELSKYHVEGYIADGIVTLGLKEVVDDGMGKLKRYLVVRKMCGTRHSMYKYPFEITEMEIIVFPSGKIY